MASKPIFILLDFIKALAEHALAERLADHGIGVDGLDEVENVLTLVFAAKHHHHLYVGLRIPAFAMQNGHAAMETVIHGIGYFFITLGDDEELNEVQKDVKVGMEFETAIDDVPYILTVIKVDDKGVTVDANHPLAGKALFFDVKVTDIKEALSDELVQGFPMAPEER